MAFGKKRKSIGRLTTNAKRKRKKITNEAEAERRTRLEEQQTRINDACRNEGDTERQTRSEEQGRRTEEAHRNEADAETRLRLDEERWTIEERRRRTLNVHEGTSLRYDSVNFQYITYLGSMNKICVHYNTKNFAEEKKGI